ncbi:MAG: S-methyl-5-thioribose-1-phosphate isomerase [Spirochaetales bacterium]|nr:S-methyl-5-thioribose-1-phosphate isomerase [Spirochaetales bacterium]
MKAIRYIKNTLHYLDQRFLPHREIWRECRTIKCGYRAIKELRVRGAPLIGVFAAYSLCVSLDSLPSDKQRFYTALADAIAYLESARPTAVNLVWALRRIEKTAAANGSLSLNRIKKAIRSEARAIHAEDAVLCGRIAEHGVRLVGKGDRILTHCNTGFLATGGDGTALAVIGMAHRLYADITVYAGETRPLLQGSRLTAWELMKRGIRCFLITDNMAASLMRDGQIDKVFVGADRIAANGDTANKIGTYGLAVAASYHRVPFYVAAPSSTFDPSLESGDGIPIEQRDGDEVRTVCGKVRIAPAGVPVCNPAFDITPSRLITAIICDRGIITPPYKKHIKEVFQSGFDM